MAKRRSDKDDYFLCPHCGAEVPPGASFCRECGASDESGWGEDEPDDARSTGYLEDDFDYDDFVRREFPEQAEWRRPSVKALLAVLVVALIIAGLLLWALSPS